MSAFTYDQILNGLLHQGVPRKAAEARAREEAARFLPEEPDPAQLRRDMILEKEEQRQVTNRFRAFGFKVRNLSQPRASKQSPGFPDLWVVHETKPIAFWWETKRQVGGRHSDAQLEFADDCCRCGVDYGTGDRYAAEEKLMELGLCWRTPAGVLEPVRERVR